MQINEPDFSFTFPDGKWTNHSTREAYDFRLDSQEQIIVARHAPIKTLTQAELQKGVIELYRTHIEAIQKHSNNSCRFDSPTCTDLPGRFEAVLGAEDIHQRVFMHVGFFGRPHKIIVVSYYDYSHAPGPDKFKSRANELFASVKVLSND